MNDIEKKLNAAYPIQMQGGAILLLIRIVSDKMERLLATEKLAEALGIDIPEEITEMMTAMNSVGSNLVQDAKVIFGHEYLDKLFTDWEQADASVEIEPTVEGSSAIN